MSHGSENADPNAGARRRLAGTADRAGYSTAGVAFHQAAIEVIYQCRNGDLALRDLQNMRADARAALVEIEREIQVQTPIDLTRDKGPTHPCVDCEKLIPTNRGFGLRCGDCMDPAGSAP